jgi:hypothetical protein
MFPCPNWDPSTPSPASECVPPIPIGPQCLLSVPSSELGPSPLHSGVLGIWIRLFLGLLDPDPLVSGTDLDPDPSLFS